MLFSCFCPFVLSYPLADSASGFLLSLLPRCNSALLPSISNWSWASFRLLFLFSLCSCLSQNISFIFIDEILTCPSSVSLQMFPPRPSAYFSFLWSYLGGFCPDLSINLFCSNSSVHLRLECAPWSSISFTAFFISPNASSFVSFL